MDQMLRRQKLQIEITVSGSFADPKADYRATRSFPRLPALDAIVDKNGDINLRAVPFDERVSPQTEIIFDLRGKLEFEGRLYAVRFQWPASRAFVATREGGGSTEALRPRLPLLSWLTRLIVYDRNDDGAVYHYCLHIAAQGCRGARGKLDPAIINRGPA